MGSPKVAVPSGHVHLIQHGILCGLQCGYLLWCGLSWSAGGQPASPWSSPKATWESLLQHLEPPPPLLPSPWCLRQGCFSHFFPLAMQQFCPFLNTFSPEVPSPWLRGLSRALWWGRLEPAGTGCVQPGAAPASPHRGPHSPSCQHLGTFYTTLNDLDLFISKSLKFIMF